MAQDLNVPIALRRTTRRSIGSVSTTESTSSRVVAPSATSSRTPGKHKTKKRVRFSDPGPEISYSSPSTTGLTPMIRRSSLGTTPSPKRRRHSTPARPRCHDEEDELAGTGETPGNNEIHFVSLRQVLDDRVKRRIRRNGLSEEMNIIETAKKRKAQEHKEELQRLRGEVAEKDEEIDRLRDSTMVYDTDRIMELEQQVEQLRTELSNTSESADQTRFDWTIAARDPFSDSCMDDEGFGDTTGFGDATVAELMCSTPSRARASFPTPPCTSPAGPSTPVSMRRLPLTPTSHAGVQACFPDPEKEAEKEALEAELGSLRFELTKLTDTLESHETVKARIADRLSAVQSSEPQEHPDVEAHLDTVLQSLSDRTAALFDLNSSLSSLGFPGSDASEIVSSLSGAFRSARLELEYLTPGEITLPLSSHGAEVLDLVLTRLRDLARKVKEDEEAIDEYHALELSLRQQLGARVEAMDGMGRELKRSTSRLKEKDEMISDLEVGTDRLKGAIEGYRRDIVELESLVQRMEDEGHDTKAQLCSEVDEGKEELKRKDDSIAELESKLASVLSQTGNLRIQLADIQTKKVLEITALNKSHGNALALRDARVTELRGEIDSINEALRNAHETIRQLRVENSGLKADIDSEKKKAKDAVDSMKAELERVLKMSEGILSTPKKSARRSSRTEQTPETSMQPGTSLCGEKAKTGKKRRRYDSGLGFLDEEEVEI
ncbi:hypothetical protein BJ170DRAFT_580540 [Xylariales sp. AK1849]|nr:hypothetical protein BJ170DRAFT_580540 [Xylariales sp. AK1849]